LLASSSTMNLTLLVVMRKKEREERF
jgi:hypothetical protein